MASSFSFGDNEAGIQVGQSFAPITVNHAPPDDEHSIASQATFDSYIFQHLNECLDGTRTDLLRRISEWAVSENQKCIFWLSGLAGAGKTTISRTVTTTFRDEKRLGASFFFKRGGGDQGNATRLIPTIVNQLVRKIPRMASGVRQAKRNDPKVVQKSLMEQFDKLILQPLFALEDPNHEPPTVIVIDALDECEPEEDIRAILKFLPRIAHLKSFPLRIFLTSRPEISLRSGFSAIPSHIYEKFDLHEIPEPIIEQDLRVFLTYRLSNIQKERSLAMNWPGEKVIRSLVKLSVPLFIFASTICYELEDPMLDPQKTLDEIISHDSNLSGLQKLYLPVLSRILNGRGEKQTIQLIGEFRDVVGSIIMLEHPLSVVSLAKLIGKTEELVRLTLSPLHSVLHVPQDGNSPVRLIHLSFREFLLDPETRPLSRLSLDARAIHKFLAQRCLSVCRFLRMNICELPSSGTLRSEISTTAVEFYLPPELTYASEFWADHLAQANDPTAVLDCAYNMLEEHFLHWVEAMAILGQSPKLVPMIDLLSAAAKGHIKFNMEFLHNAQRFININKEMILIAPLQIYLSGLLFDPSIATVTTRSVIHNEIPNQAQIYPALSEPWGEEVKILYGHRGTVCSVAYSPDGKQLASASADRTVRLWDSANGYLQMSLDGHSAKVLCVSFSPLGNLLASGSEDKTVRLWDPVTFALRKTLRGHPSSVWSVAFSEDGKQLASCSKFDTRVFLWDLTTFTLRKYLQVHQQPMFVAFSRDGTRLTSASYEGEILLWNVSQGTIQNSFQASNSSVESVALSRDGELLASTSFSTALPPVRFFPRRVVRLWNFKKGSDISRSAASMSPSKSLSISSDGKFVAACTDTRIEVWNSADLTQRLSFEGSFGKVECVTISPCGRHLVSGSGDGTLRIWDATTNMQRNSFEMHFDGIALLFSHSGRLLASCSTQIQLWDATTGTIWRDLGLRSFRVKCMAFSPDDSLFSFALFDNSIEIWNTKTGAPHKTIWGSLRISALAFSPDNLLLASATDSMVIELWDLVPGTRAGLIEALQLWGLASCNPLNVLKGHSAAVRCVTFSPDGRTLLSGSADGTIGLWDTVTGSLQTSFVAYTGEVVAVAVSHDGQMLASSTSFRKVILSDLPTCTMKVVINFGEQVHAMEFSADGSHLNTNFGSFRLDTMDLQSGYTQWYHSPSSANYETYLHKCWVWVRGSRLLWLPRHRYDVANLRENTLALGYGSKGVTFIRLQL